MLRLLLALFLFLGPAVPAGAAERTMSPAERYELGMKYMKRGYYSKALEQFNRIRNYYRDDPYALKAELAIADLDFKKGDWDQARLAYQDFQRLHPHDYADYVVYRIGLCYWKKAPRAAGRDQTATRQAVDAWGGFSTRFPDSEYREEVEELLREGRERLARKEYLIGRFYYRRRAWRAAEGRLEGLLRDYPEAEIRARALYLLALARARDGDLEGAREARGELAGLEGSERLLRRLDRKLARIEREARD